MHAFMCIYGGVCIIMAVRFAQADEMLAQASTEAPAERSDAAL